MVDPDVNTVLNESSVRESPEESSVIREVDEEEEKCNVRKQKTQKLRKVILEPLAGAVSDKIGSRSSIKKQLKQSAGFYAKNNKSFKASVQQL